MDRRIRHPPPYNALLWSSLGSTSFFCSGCTRIGMDWQIFLCGQKKSHTHTINKNLVRFLAFVVFCAFYGIVVCGGGARKNIASLNFTPRSSVFQFCCSVSNLVKKIAFTFWPNRFSALPLLPWRVARTEERTITSLYSIWDIARNYYDSDRK